MDDGDLDGLLEAQSYTAAKSCRNHRNHSQLGSRERISGSAHWQRRWANLLCRTHLRTSRMGRATTIQVSKWPVAATSTCSEPLLQTRATFIAFPLKDRIQVALPQGITCPLESILRQRDREQFDYLRKKLAHMRDWKMPSNEYQLA